MQTIDRGVSSLDSEGRGPTSDGQSRRGSLAWVPSNEIEKCPTEMKLRISSFSFEVWAQGKNKSMRKLDRALRICNRNCAVNFSLEVAKNT